MEQSYLNCENFVVHGVTDVLTIFILINIYTDSYGLEIFLNSIEFCFILC